MSCFLKANVLLCPLVAVGAIFLSIVAVSAENPVDRGKPKAQVVELFAGIEDGRIEAQLIANGSTKCNLLVTNKTDVPLSVQLPPAFAGVPVLAQQPGPFGQPNPFNNGPRNNRGNNSPQQIGIGPGPGMFNPMNPMMNNRGQNQNRMPGFQFNIAPEKVGKLKLPAVCLEHGKPNPRPKIKYAIRPIESVTKKPGVAEICAMLGQGEIGQREAQLAAWHINNDMSWDQLTNLRKRAALGTVAMFTGRELRTAKKAVEVAVELAKKNKPEKSKGAESASVSLR